MFVSTGLFLSIGAFQAKDFGFVSNEKVARQSTTDPGEERDGYKRVKLQKTSSGVLPLLILVPTPCLPLCHTHSPSFSFHLPPLILGFCGKSACGSPHGIHFPVTHSLLGTNNVLDDFARDSNAAVFFVIFDAFNLYAFSVDFVSVE